ncbi:carbohydrate esterase family 12 protein [Viridothelium virens]|uniref:Carbohydrate esterase family 12 protein n=1 Tax=Viridothelium virens TaxID=1048519 RepID=A0A6A6HD47_VIRVR|nr:carbohydrate esterase family 12 protein [Viridothelium virens]
MLSSLLSFILLAISYQATTSSALPSHRPLSSKPAAFFLAGDSTTATQSSGGGGWGDGFINTTLHNGATGKNFGHNGATTVSFRAGGDWSWVLGNASASLPSYNPYVTIQFGHNDQKPAANISIAEFTANLVQFVKDVRNVPATPILVTSLSRRNYENTTDGPRIVENLADVTAAAINAAQQAGCTYINLNQASENYLNEIGPDDAYTYNLNPTDYTHLNDEGSIVFGNLVAVLMNQNVTGVGEYVSPEEEIAEAISEGVYYFPEGCEGEFC